MQDFRSDISAKAEAALEDEPAPLPEEQDKGADPAEPEDDSVPADGGDTPDEPEEGEEDLDEDATEEEPDEGETEEDDLDEEEEKPLTRSEKRIKQLIKEKEALKEQLATKTDAPSEKVVEKKLLDKGYTKEQIEEGQRFIESLPGYVSPEKVAEMQKTLQRFTDNDLMQQDSSDLSAALVKTKSALAPEDVMKYVQKWGKSKDPRIAARASLDYPAIIKLISGKKMSDPVVVKKKIAPKVPSGGGGAITKSDDKADEGWNPGDRSGSMERLLEKAHASLDEGE